MNNYNSITIDEEVKYGNIVLTDGTFDFEHLSKSLDFCREFGKEVRLNTLMFYMDFPNNLKGLPVNEESRQLVKNRLMDYVDSTTRFIGENYSDIVRSIDVFNELLNRHPLSGCVVDNDRYIELMESFGLDPKGEYYLRSELPQIESLYSNFDNGYIIHNTHKPFEEGHTHLKSYKMATTLIDNCIKRKKPNSTNPYIITSH